MEVRIADTSYVGDHLGSNAIIVFFSPPCKKKPQLDVLCLSHLFCRISRQIPPSAYTLGWNILLMKRTLGGLFGYSSVNSVGFNTNKMSLRVLCV